MEKLLQEIRTCELCANFLPNKPKPVIRTGKNSKIVVIGQAPGQKVQDSGIPWDDLSGKELRRWLGVEKEVFYNTDHFALMPMGFCYPGKGSSGDLPPRTECAPQWHEKVLREMKNVRLIILIGSYAQNYYLKNKLRPTLTETVKDFKTYLPDYLPLVHPSPRNKIWQKKNPWFEKEVVPTLKNIVKTLI